MHVRLWSKPDCPLCDEAADDLSSLAAEFGLTIERRSILEEPALEARFGSVVPVVEIGDGPPIFPPHNWLSLRAAVVAAAAATPSAATPSVATPAAVTPPGQQPRGTE
jgi:hypothetical protein